MTFHQLQNLVALIIVLNVLDALTTCYGITHKIAREQNGAAAGAMAWLGTTWSGLLLVKVPAISMALMAALPQLFAPYVPNGLLVFVADIPDWSWYVQAIAYAAVVINNVRIVWSHVLSSIDEEKGTHL